MYRDVAKRILAVGLAFCMAGSTPDFTLLAKGAADQAVNTEAESVTPAGGLEEYDSERPADAGAETGTESTPSFYAAEMPYADGKISLPTSPDITKPESLPNQIKTHISDGFVNKEILGLTILYQGTALTQILDEASGADGYKVSATVNSAGTSANLVITGSGIYEGTIRYNNVGLGADIEECSVTLSYESYSTASYSYEGREIRPSVTVTTPGESSVGSANYDLEYEDNVNVGRAAVILRGKGGYAGTKNVSFEIVPTGIRYLFDMSCGDAVYNKAKASAGGMEPSTLTVRNKKTGEAANENDYTYTCSNNTALTTSMQRAELVIRGDGNCNGDYTLEYDIVKASFDESANASYAEDDKIIVEPEYTQVTYTGEAFEPAVTIYQKDESTGTLSESSDYTVEYRNNTNVGTAQIIITGKGNYEGSRTVPFTIGAYNLADVDPSQIAVDPDGYEYQGRAVIPEDLGLDLSNLTAASGDVLVKGRDYEVSYAKNTSVGNGMIRIRGINNCTGELDVSFVIWKNMGSSDIRVDAVADQPYTGSVIHPEPVVRDKNSVLVKEKHYTLAYPDGDYTGIGTRRTITVRGDGTYYRGETTANFNITARDMSNMKLSFKEQASNNTFTFNGSKIQKDITITDQSGSVELPKGDFDIVYSDRNGNPSDCRNAGAYEVRISPKSDKLDFYNGEYLSLPFTIQQKELVRDDQEYAVKLLKNGVEITEIAYTGSEIELTVNVLDKHRNAANGEYSDTHTAGFPIASSDYDVSYSNHKNAGRATVTITGKGNYTGTVTKDFRIIKKKLSEASITMAIDPDVYVYTGHPIIPNITTLEIDGRELDPDEIADEFVITSNAVNVGDTGTFTLTGTKNYEGSVSSGSVQFTIEQQDIGSSDVQVTPIGNYPFEEGKAAEPVPEILYNGTKLELGVDFTVTYKNNTEKDNGVTDPAKFPTVEITGTGNFKGSRTVTFHIRDSIGKAEISGLDDLVYTYTSRECRPRPNRVTLEGAELVEGVDYEVTYKNNINAAELDAENPPTVIVSGINEYGGVSEKTFTITQVEMSLASYGQLKAPLSYRVGNSPMFTGDPVIPTMKIEYRATDPNSGESFIYTLEEDVDYVITTAASDANINVGGDKVLQVRPMGNFKGPGTGPLNMAYYTIKPKPVSSAEILIPDIELGDVVDLPAQPKITITDTKRKGAGENEGAYVEADGTYVLKEGVDYTLRYTNNKVPGKASVVITGMGNYSGSVTKSFTIPGNLSNATITFLNSTVNMPNSGEYWYTGSQIDPQIKVETTTDNGDSKTLARGTDYQLEVIGDNINKGNPTLRLTGLGAYAGSTREIGFAIKPVDLSDASVKINMAASVDFLGDGENVWPGDEKNKNLLTIMLGRYQLKQETDYICVPEEFCWQPSMAIGRRYKLQIVAGTSGNFVGQAEKEYTIGNNFDVEITFAGGNSGPFVYTGREITPELVVKDKKKNYTLKKKSSETDFAADYDVTYSDNINAGTVTVMVFGLGGQDGYSTQYCGSKTITFQIQGKPLNSPEIEVASLAAEKFVYTTKEICPEPAVTWKGYEEDGQDLVLEAGADFKYVYGSNINAGTATVKIVPANGNNNFTGSSAEYPFTIEPKNLEDDDVTLEGIPDQIYTGDLITPNLNIHWGDDPEHPITVTQNDYKLTYGEEGNQNVGTVEMTIEGHTNYTGTIHTQFRIVKVKLSDIIPDYAKTQQWTGKQITPPVAMTYLNTDGGTVIMNSPEQWGYTITYGANQVLGTTSGTITITADPTGNCEGDPVTWRFAIIKRHISDELVVMTGIEPSYELDEITQVCRPKPELNFTPDATTRYTLREGYDYTLEYANETAVGTATLTVKGIGNFDEERSQDYQITNDLIKYIEEAKVDAARIEYDGKEHHPPVNIRFSLNTITEDDYELVYDEDCTSAGEHIVKIVGVGEYSGELELPFTIHRRDIGHIEFTIEPQAYTGSPIDPVIIGIDSEISEEVLGGDIYETIAIRNNTEIGKASVTFRAVETSNYIGEREVEFDIVAADLEAGYIDCSVIESPQAYTGSEICPEVVLTDTRRNSDGTALAAREGELYTLQKDVDYEITYTNNIYPKLESDLLPAVVTITGIGNYAGTRTQMFDIQADLALADIEEIPGQPYTGEPVTPEPVVRLGERLLVKDFDYTVSYANNIERGTATVTVTAKEGTLYTGSQTVSFSISRDLAGAEIRLIDRAFTYTGSEIRPTAVVEFEGSVLEAGVDYELEYENNIDVGTAAVLIRGINGYDGLGRTEFEIVKRSITRCKFENVVDKTYAGTPTSQNLVVKDGNRKLTLNKDYTVAYANHANPGAATLEISGIGNYGGIKTILYKIKVADMTAVKAQGNGDYVQLNWTEVSGADGYAVYDANDRLIGKTTALTYRQKDLDAVTTYQYKVRAYIMVGSVTHYGGFSNTVKATTSVAKPKVTVKAGKSRAKVSWKRIRGVSGYEIYRSEKKKSGFKKIRTAAKASITSYTNKRLTSKKKYYYKIRAYKKVNGKKVYGKYSAPKSVKAK